MKCALTGHRELPEKFDVNKLYDLLEQTVRDGYDTFYCGMAKGFDLLALDCLVSLGRKYPLKLIACIPYLGQDRKYTEKEKEKYTSLLEWCDEKKVFSTHYFNGCCQTRDRYMVDEADIVVAYCTRDKGGTAYTVAYAKKKGKEVRMVE